MLRDVSVLQTGNRNLGPVDVSGSWRFPPHRAPMSSHCGASFDDSVSAGNEVLFSYNDIRKGAIHHDADLSQTFEASRHRRTKMMHEAFVKQMVNAVDVVFVLEDSCELSHRLFVRFDRGQSLAASHRVLLES